MVTYYAQRKQDYAQLKETLLEKLEPTDNSPEHALALSKIKLNSVIKWFSLVNEFALYHNTKQSDKDILQQHFFVRCPSLVLYCLYNYELNYLKTKYNELTTDERKIAQSKFNLLKDGICGRGEIYEIDRHICDYISKDPWHSEINLEMIINSKKLINHGRIYRIPVKHIIKQKFEQLRSKKEAVIETTTEGINKTIERLDREIEALIEKYRGSC